MERGSMSKDPIVVGTDGSATAELAVDRAAELGQALGTAVHVVTAYTMASGGEQLATGRRAAAGTSTLTDDARTAAEEIVARAKERLEDRGLTVHTHVRAGDAGQELIATAEQEGAQLVVVGNRGMTGLGRILGSVPNLVSHRAKCGVVIVPTTRQSDAAATPLHGKPVVVGTNGSDTARLAVREAVRMAAALGAEVHIVSGYKPIRGAHIAGAAEGAARVWAPLPDSFVESVLQHSETIARTHGVPATTHAFERDPAKALLDVADEVGAGMIVVGSKGMQGTERFSLGNVSHTISHRAPCDVHIVFTGERAGSDGASPESAA